MILFNKIKLIVDIKDKSLKRSCIKINKEKLGSKKIVYFKYNKHI